MLETKKKRQHKQKLKLQTNDFTILKMLHILVEQAYRNEGEITVVLLQRHRDTRTLGDIIRILDGRHSLELQFILGTVERLVEIDEVCFGKLDFLGIFGIEPTFNPTQTRHTKQTTASN